jgi:Lhr-like helicase
MTKTKNSAKKPQKKLVNVDLHKDILEEFIEKSKETGIISYEELISFGDKNNVTDQEMNEILRIFEKENIELVTQEELENDPLKKEEFEEVEPARLKLKANSILMG